VGGAALGLSFLPLGADSQRVLAFAAPYGGGCIFGIPREGGDSERAFSIAPGIFEGKGADFGVVSSGGVTTAGGGGGFSGLHFFFYSELFGEGGWGRGEHRGWFGDLLLDPAGVCYQHISLSFSSLRVRATPVDGRQCVGWGKLAGRPNEFFTLGRLFQALILVNRYLRTLGTAFFFPVFSISLLYGFLRGLSGRGDSGTPMETETEAGRRFLTPVQPRFLPGGNPSGRATGTRTVR